jgi:hypothetical protein
MTSFNFNTYRALVKNMVAHDIEKEHFAFQHAKLTFDVIFAITSSGYNFNTTFDDQTYYALRHVLELNTSNSSLSSFAFLRLLSAHAPKQSKCVIVLVSELRFFAKSNNIDESEKIYFKGWNPHTSDKRQARNFDKTEFYFGKKIADYCRMHNISSIWTSNPQEEHEYINPDLDS